MAWNEPGGGKDPWGGGNRGNNNDGPPDIDEVLKNLQKKFAGFMGGGNGRDSGGFNSAWVVLALIVGLGFYAFKGAGIVNEQERAVILRLGVYDETKQPGFRWNPPLVDDVYTVNVTKVRQWSTTEEMLTEDLNIVVIKLSVQYSIADARDFVLRIKSPESSLHQATNSALRHVVGSNKMHDVLTQGREAIAAQIQTRVQAYLDSYQSGIRVEKVNVEDSNPPSQVQEAFDDVIKAREDEERKKNEAEAYANSVLPRAQGEAQRMIEEATAYKEKVIAQAEGEARRFELLLDEYSKAPEVTRKRLYLDAVEQVLSVSSKVMVDIEGGNNMLYLPLDKLTQPRSRTIEPSYSSADLDALADQVFDRIKREAATKTRRREGR